MRYEANIYSELHVVRELCGELLDEASQILSLGRRHKLLQLFWSTTENSTSYWLVSIFVDELWVNKSSAGWPLFEAFSEVKLTLAVDNLGYYRGCRQILNFFSRKHISEELQWLLCCLDLVYDLLRYLSFVNWEREYARVNIKL